MTHEQWLDEPAEYIDWCDIFAEQDAEVAETLRARKKAERERDDEMGRH